MSDFVKTTDTHTIACFMDLADANRCIICWSTVYGGSHTKMFPITKVQKVCRTVGSGSKLQIQDLQCVSKFYNWHFKDTTSDIYRNLILT